MDQKKKVNLIELLDYQTELLNDDAFRVSQNALTKSNLESVILDQQISKTYTEEFSHNIHQTSTKITNQQNSGRCWIFATMNMIRDKFITDNNLENFEFSQSYLHFWDKFEKANVFLNQMIDMVNIDPTDRVLFALLELPIQDGGFFEWSKNLILKYGLVPKSEMDDSFSSANTLIINRFFDVKLKQAAVDIRKNSNDKATMFSIKEKYLFEIYKILLSSYGIPPKKFDLFLKDKKGKIKKTYGLTPLTFLKKIKFNFDDYLTIVYTPYKKIKPFQRYELVYTTAMQEKGNVIFTAVDKPTFKLMSLAMIFQKKPVWFGCDVDHFFASKKGLWASDIYDFESFFNIKFEKNLSQHIEYSQIGSNHAMVLQGFDLDQKDWEKTKKNFFAKAKNQKLLINDFKELLSLIPIKKWLVENSWGEKLGNKGIFTISQDWFNDYVYEIILDKQLFKHFLKNPIFVSKKEFGKFKNENNKTKSDFYYQELLLNALETKPIKLPIWEPFNTFLRKGGG